MTKQFFLAAASGLLIGIALIAFMTDYERGQWNPVGWWIGAASLCLPCAGNTVLGVAVVRRKLRRELLLALPLIPLLPIVVGGFSPKWPVLLILAVVIWFVGALSAFVVGSSPEKAPSS